MATNLVIPVKFDGGDDTAFEYPKAINKNADGLAANGFYPQHASSGDQNAGIERNASGDLVLGDALAGSFTLSQLVGSGSGAYSPFYEDFLLDCEPDGVTNNYAVTRTSGVVTQETWTNASNSRLIKSIDYTRTSGLLTQEDRKIFSPADGTTLVAHLRVVFTRTAGLVTSAVYTRVV